MIGHPDIAADAIHCRDVDGLRNIPELILEFISRRDFIAVYLVVVSFWCFSLAFRGLRLGSTKGFGWRAEDATDEAASSTGTAWLAIASSLLATGAGLWFTA